MNSKDQVKAAEDYARNRMAGFDGGHDWWHVVRVRRLAERINGEEKLADPFILDIAAILHDVCDSKFTDGDSTKDMGELGIFLDNIGLAGIRGRILEIIGKVSYSSRSRSGNTDDTVLLILQDADRLDAMGAIGIARAFNYGGFRNRAIHEPADGDGGCTPSTISHFYDKLLKLKDMMNTPTGRRIASGRHAFLEDFLNRFYDEWESLV